MDRNAQNGKYTRFAEDFIDIASRRG